MQLPDWFYGIAAILAGVAIGWLTWKNAATACARICTA